MTRVEFKIKGESKTNVTYVPDNWDAKDFIAKVEEDIVPAEVVIVSEEPVRDPVPRRKRAPSPYDFEE